MPRIAGSSSHTTALVYNTWSKSDPSTVHGAEKMPFPGSVLART